MNPTAKGQISAEFFLLIMASMIIFIIFFAIFDNMNNLLGRLQTLDRSKAVASSVARAVNAAFLGSDGLVVNVSIPSNYGLELHPWAVIAKDRSNFSGSAPLMTGNVSIAVAEGATVVQVRNENGTIRVSG